MADLEQLTLSPAKMRALELLVNTTLFGDTETGRSFAMKLWPESPSWGKRTRPRRSGTQNGALGGTMPMLGARTLHHLETLGLAAQKIDRHWIATPRGQKLVDEITSRKEPA